MAATPVPQAGNALAPAPVPAPEPVECCPALEECNAPDAINPTYQLPYPTTVVRGDQKIAVTVEVSLHFRLTRTPTRLGLGEPVHSVTLLPGETVRLAMSDAASRFSFDSETNLAHFNASASSESSFMASMAHAVSNLAVYQNDNRSQDHEENSFSGGGSAGLDLGFLSIGGHAGGSSYHSHSTQAATSFLSAHADASSQHVEVATRAKHAVSVGTVHQRTHSQGESENHWESTARTFTNANQCRAVSYLFRQVVKCQQVTWEFVSVGRRVLDPANPTGSDVNQAPPLTGMTVVPQRVSVASSKLLEIQRTAHTAALERTGRGGSGGGVVIHTAADTPPIPADVAAQAIAQVDAELAAAGLIDASTGAVTAEAKARYGWSREITLPTPGIVVKGCLDDCGTCEPELVRRIQLELDRLELANKLLARQTELLDKSQEYRCCPAPELPGV